MSFQLSVTSTESTHYRELMTGNPALASDNPMGHTN